MMDRRKPGILVALLLLAATCYSHAESGAEAWLRYAPIHSAQALHQYQSLPTNIVALDSSAVVQSATSETVRAIYSMLARTLRIESTLPGEDSFVLGTVEELHTHFPGWKPPELRPEGYWLGTVHSQGHSYLLIAGADPRGVLYGTFDLLAKIAREENLASLNETHSPSAPVRWINQWDNLDGSIERGYAGRSIFFDNGSVRSDLARATEYARLLASIGINGCTVNNVNADLRTLTPEMIPQLARIADAFRPWGVKLSISVALSSPKTIGGLDTFDPKDPRVIAWWHAKADEIYAKIPDLGGFEVKADSEGQAGPSQYGRTPVDAANMLAEALKPRGGLLLYRAFVYNHHLDWTDPKADRARAAYDIFHPLDGKFDDNVIVQIKYGPIDFQVREPVSPLFAGLEHTNTAIELQVTQEYTGQERHLVFLVPLWKKILDFDLRAQNRSTPVKEIVSGKSFHRLLGGFVAVAGVGLDTNWLGHPLALANLYGFGRLAWDPNTSAQQIADDWTKLTFGNDPVVVSTVTPMLLTSWRLYEQYTGPLGLGTLTDILQGHYGPGIETAERNGWGQWIRADHDGIGMDRTVATGTGYIGQYPPEVARLYESLQSCPDALLLFMHHVPYTHRLHSGETVIQYIYDSHYAGAAGAAALVTQWGKLRGHIDDECFDKVLALQQYQAGHAIVWRDAVTTWFYKMSGIADDKARVGNNPDRIEAESMRLSGYTSIDITPWEAASAGKAVICKNQPSCNAVEALYQPAGVYDIAIQYFDLHEGASKYKVLLNHHLIGEWTANDILPGSDKLNGDSSTRHVLKSIALHPGDQIEIEGTPDGPEPAPLDYIEITPSSERSHP
jgi:alpha-glucuronidase